MQVLLGEKHYNAFENVYGSGMHKGVTLRAYLDAQTAGKGQLEEEVFLMASPKMGLGARNKFSTL